MAWNVAGFRIAAVLLCTIATSVATAQDSATDTREGIAPDIREDDTRFKVQRGDFVAVPIPISNPTLDTGLVAGAAYFYAQTEEQAAAQPASLTAAAAMYTSNDSRAFAVVQQNYWREDRWRFTGAIGGADLRLSLLTPDPQSGGISADWRIDGSFLLARLSRRLAGDWYGGLLARIIDADQSIETGSQLTEPEPGNFDTESSVRSSGLGVTFEFDTRDMPTNPYSGRYLTAQAVFNDENLGSNRTYQSYSANYRAYHDIGESLVIAWEIQGCKRGGTSPLWDACRVDLRGFAATDFLGKGSASGQVEARWRLSRRWGLVGFGGAGYIDDSFSGLKDHEPLPSYGAGVRFMVLPAKRFIMRLDLAWSEDDEAIHFSVGESF